MEPTSYPPGSPNWVDVSSPDIAAAAGFYSELFGWNAHDLGEQAGHYTMFDIDGKIVAAGGPLMGDDAGPPHWTTYFSVENADDTVASIEANGGTILMPAMDVFDAGRMAVAADPSGGAFAIWQPGTTIGAQLVNVANTWAWNELAVRDPDPVLAFYSAVFGWAIRPVHAEDGVVVYREILVEGRSCAGCMQMDDNWPERLPTHWMVYFSVDDCDASATRATELGGSVHVPPSDIPGVGRFSLLEDPTGAHFAVIRFVTPEE